jgi:hypothetical protein
MAEHNSSDLTPEDITWMNAPMGPPGTAWHEWKPIATAPRSDKPINVWLGHADEEDVEFYCVPGTRFSSGWHWRQGKWRPMMGLGMPVVTVQPTHWMEMPPPPVEER